MKFILALVFSLFAAFAYAQAPAGFELTFDEEFVGPYPNVSDSATFTGNTWYTMTKPCCMTSSTTPPQLQYMWPNWPPGPPNAGTVSPLSIIPGGGLNIRLSQQTPTGGVSTYIGHPTWIGGMIASVAPDGKGFSQQYGFIEFKAKMPNSLGTWGGLWMMAQPGADINSSDGEIDIMETYGAFDTGPTGAYVITVHDWKHGTVPFQQTITTGDLTTAFHTFGMNWTAKTLDFYFDGGWVAGTTTPDVMKQPYYILANLGMGGGWPTTATVNPSDMQIQYIRMYENRWVTVRRAQ